jgi:tetratricopeptide (TPR) repeat protein
MSLPPSHDWVVAPFRVDRAGVPCCPATEWHEIDAHRNFRGVYTAAAGLIRQLIGDASTLTPNLLPLHQLTLLSVCPEAEHFIPVSAEVADWLQVSREGNARSWTRRLAHGLTDFLLAYAARRPAARLGICLENADQADPLDQEFVSVLLRRADPSRLSVRVCSSSDQIDDVLSATLRKHARAIAAEPAARASETPEPWRVWMKNAATGWAGEGDALREIAGYVNLSATPPPVSTLAEFLTDFAERLAPAERLRLATEYVASECTSDRLVLTNAYAGTSVGERQALHRARIEVLEASNRTDLALGAIPLHYEWAAADVEPLLAASKRCMHLGYYGAALDWARRGLKMVADAPRGKPYGDLARNALFALLLLGRFNAVEAMCDDNLAHSSDPALLAHTTYARAILCARLYDPARRDFEAARTWIEKSLAFTEMLAPSEARAVNLAFLRNTLALVEMRTGGMTEAHELLTAALEYIAREAPGKYRQECVLLLHNRARLQVACKHTDAAIADLTELLRQQPQDSEAYLDRGLLHQRAGRHEEALADYNAAIRWSPPYPEPHFNRAQSLAALGRPDEALADYDYVLTLQPDHVEARNDRACLYYHRGMFGAAHADAEAALRVNPKHARLLCLRGLCEMEDGNSAAAQASLTQSIEVDPSLPDAWANRATARFKQGDPEGALADLTRALSLRKDASAHYNRGRIYEIREEWIEAAADYSQALRLASRDVSDLQKRLRRCQGMIDGGGQGSS